MRPRPHLEVCYGVLELAKESSLLDYRLQDMVARCGTFELAKENRGLERTGRATSKVPWTMQSWSVGVPLVCDPVWAASKGIVAGRMILDLVAQVKVT